MAKVILIESTGNKTKGIVADRKEVIIPSKREVEIEIQKGMQAIADIAAGVDVTDPSEEAVKHCTRCMNLGRVFIHPIKEFSLLKNGKRHSQCKTCRSDQACEWQLRKAAERKIYQAGYQKTRKYVPRRKGDKTINTMLNAMDGDKKAEEQKPNAIDSLFVAYVQE